jgi:hypothetical protein
LMWVITIGIDLGFKTDNSLRTFIN